MAPMLKIDDIIDKSGELKLLLKTCPHDAPRLTCRLKPFFRCHPDVAPPQLVHDILLRHFNCPVHQAKIRAMEDGKS